MRKRSQNLNKTPKNSKRKMRNKKKQKHSSNAIESYLRKQSLKTLVRSKLRLSYAKVQGDHMSQVYDLVLSQVEPPLIEMVLEKSDHNQVRAAEILGINRNTLRKRITKYNIKP
jgi:DNA-binding protein Fis